MDAFSLKLIRDELYLTNRGLAQVLGVAEATICRYLSSDRPIPQMAENLIFVVLNEYRETGKFPDSLNIDHKNIRYPARRIAEDLGIDLKPPEPSSHIMTREEYNKLKAADKLKIIQS